MSKQIMLVLTLILVASMACSIQLSQSTLTGSGDIARENREVSGFDQVDICCGMQLFLTQGDREDLEIEADDNLLPEIVTRVSGDRLIIEFKDQGGRTNYRPSQPVRCTLTVKDIRRIESSGGGYVESEAVDTDRLTLDLSGGGDAQFGSVSAQTFEVDISGGGEITADTLRADRARFSLSGGSDATIDELIADDLRLESSGSGDVAIAGRVTEQNADISGGGSYRAEDLESQIAAIEISGGGNGTVWVTDSLEANLSGGSDLSYYGNPQIFESLSGDSELNSLGER